MNRPLSRGHTLSRRFAAAFVLVVAIPSVVVAIVLSRLYLSALYDTAIRRIGIRGHRGRRARRLASGPERPNRPGRLSSDRILYENSPVVLRVGCERIGRELEPLR